MQVCVTKHCKLLCTVKPPVNTLKGININHYVLVCAELLHDINKNMNICVLFCVNSINFFELYLYLYFFYNLVTGMLIFANIYIH